MSKEIEQLTDDDLAALWPQIGGTPHLYEYGKEELRELLTTGYAEEGVLSVGYYTMAAIVDQLRSRGFAAPIDDTREHPAPLEIQDPLN